MGLSKKLAPNIPRSESIANVDFQWSTQSYTLKEIISKFKLPCVVQCSADSCSVLWAKFQFDLKQPLLLYSVRSVSKISARTVRPVANQSDFVEFGPPLVIPEDYEGWFSMVETEFDTPPRHTNVEQVAESDSDLFLVATRVPAFIVRCGESSGVLGQHYLNPGDVLRKQGFVNGPLDASSHNNFSTKDKHHLRCKDSKEEEYIIPFSHRGLFYDAKTDVGGDAPGVINTNQIMSTGGSIFPLTLRHIQGDLPALNYSFTGTIQCNHIFSEQTIIACSIDADSPIPLELECKSKIRFAMALNEVDFKATGEYMRAFDYCHNRGEKYAKSIKISFTLRPEVSTLEELDLSLYDNGIDIEDVDAQSEFDFDWDPDKRESNQPVETVVKSHDTPGDSVDLGTSFELGQDSDKIIIKKAVEYTVSAESEDTVGEEDVTVDSSLFEETFDVNNTASPVTTVGHYDTDSDRNGLITDDADQLNERFNTDSSNGLQFIGNLSQVIMRGQLLKEEVTRTSSGVDDQKSKNGLSEDWGPAIPVRQGGSVLNSVPDNGSTVMISQVCVNGGVECSDEQGSDTDTVCSDTCDTRIIDQNKDVSGRLTSYRSLGSLDKIDLDNEEAILRELVPSEFGKDAVSLSDDEQSVGSLNRPMDGLESENEETDSSLSESAFILPNGSIRGGASTNSVNENEEKNDAYTDFCGVSELDYDNEVLKKGSALKRAPALKRRSDEKKTTKVIDMSLEEAVV